MPRIFAVLLGAILAMSLAPPSRAAEVPAGVAGLEGEWDGTLNLGPSGELRLAFHITADGKGSTFDSVDQGVYGGPVSAVTRDGAKVRLEIDAVKALAEGELSADGQTLTTIFTQGALKTGLVLKRLPPGAPSPWPAPARPLTAAPPENWTTPGDADVRKALAARVDEQRQAPGLVVGIITPEGRRVVAYGAVDAGGAPMAHDTLFEIGSITKVFTSLVLADMVGKGEVRLDDPISKYLPAGITAPSHNGKTITLADLATHTSGLPRLPDNFAPKDPTNPYADYGEDQLFAFLKGYTLTRDPGEKWDYSNLGVGLLGDLLARRAGTDYATLVRQRVLAPLGMASTTVALSPDQKRRLAPGHDPRLAPAANWDLTALAGAGALRSDADDMLTFLAAAMGLAETPLKADFAAMLATRRAAAGAKVDQALGWQVIKGTKGEIVTHSGGTGGYRAFLGYSPDKRVGVVVLSNAATIAGVDDIGYHILVGTPLAVLTPPPPPPPARHAVTLDGKALDALVGRYQLAPTATVTVTRDGERLMAQLTGQQAFEVFPESATRVFWKIVDAQADFTLGADGKATSMTLHQGGRNLAAPRVP